MIGSGNMNENVQPCVDCEMVTKYNTIFLHILMNISLICALIAIKHALALVMQHLIG